MTRQQRWAHKAFEAVRRASEAYPDGNKRQQYATYGKKAAVLLQQSGVVQALAFLRSRGEVGKRFVDDLAEVWGMGKTGDKTAGDYLQAHASKMPLSEYMALSRDLIQLGIWMRRFVATELADVSERDSATLGDAEAGEGASS